MCRQFVEGAFLNINDNNNNSNNNKTKLNTHCCGSSYGSSTLDMTIDQHNIMIHVLGAFSANVRNSIRELTEEKRKSDKTLNRMQEAILRNSLHIARSFKILAE